VDDVGEMDGLGGISSTEEITLEELQLAARNHGMPLEGLRYDVTPIGMHYLLIHFDIPYVDPDTWELEIGGRVHTPLSLSMPEILAAPSVTMPVTMECAGNGRARLRPRPLSQPWLSEAVGTAEWTGTPVAGILERAGIGDDAVEFVFTGADHGTQGDVEQDYERSLPVTDAMRNEVLLAYAMNGQPLPPQHGAPLRLLVPGWYGMTSVKWLRRITAVSEPFDGFQMDAYRLRQDPDDAGTPATRMQPRALLVPPGFPDFFARMRTLDAGPCRLVGRAWSGWAPVTRVEVSTDGARTWHEADLEQPAGPFAWSRWTFAWDATAGDRELVVRAWDEAGNVQPVDQPWNYHGLSNNMAQRVPVSVR
jgi:DMSO/TMAO reductase YedYZ molybdopterin-dependent catalytic subunit